MLKRVCNHCGSDLVGNEYVALDRSDFVFDPDRKYVKAIDLCESCYKERIKLHKKLDDLQ